MIESLKSIVRNAFIDKGSDHDWYHIERVYHMAMHLQEHEGGDKDVIACAALLHDISDHKLNGGILNDNGRVSRDILTELGYEESLIEKVTAIVDAVSFKGAKSEDKVESLEMAIVRDADRLDAMGAIGIARAFHFGGNRNRPFFVPGVNPTAHHSFEAYHKDQSHTMNHFHEKLLLLQDRLHTETARSIGKERHLLMEHFVASFYKDWYFMNSTGNRERG